MTYAELAEQRASIEFRLHFERTPDQRRAWQELADYLAAQMAAIRQAETAPVNSL